MEEEKLVTNPVKAIRKKCLECCCGNQNEVRECTIKGCALYPFRFGKNPYRKQMSEEQRAMMAERMKKMLDSKKEI